MNRETRLVEYTFPHEQLALIKRIKACKDFYRIFGTKKNASVRKIRKAYKKLALKLHPDKNHAPGAEDAFKILTNAVSILSDRKTRQHYDEYVYAEEEVNRMARDTVADMYIFLVVYFWTTILSMRLFGSTAFRTHYFLDLLNEDFISTIRFWYSHLEETIVTALELALLYLFFIIFD